MCFSATRTLSPVRGLRPTRASRRLTENAPNPRSSTRSPRANAAAISSKIAVTITSTSRWYRCGFASDSFCTSSDFVIPNAAPRPQEKSPSVPKHNRRVKAKRPVPRLFPFGQGAKPGPALPQPPGRPASPASAFVFGLVLPLGVLAASAVDRRAENVAEAGARIGRAEFGHCALFLVDFAGLDRQGHLARGAIDRRDLGVDFFADGK